MREIFVMMEKFCILIAVVVTGIYPHDKMTELHIHIIEREKREESKCGKKLTTGEC